MRQLILLALALGFAASASALTPSTSNVFRPEQKPVGPAFQNPTERIQGDTVEDPFFVTGDLPFTGSGNTCGYANDYDGGCPYPGSTSPDVVYQFVPAVNMAITLDLCGSTYDTTVYVFENTVGNVIACNDDDCAFQSMIRNIPVTTDNIYYIVVDGYGGSCGNYNLIVSEYQPCILECPAGAMLEGEPDCYDGYNDVYNGGCNAIPYPIFQILAPADEDITICGTTGVFQNDMLQYRDTDWFQLDLTEGSNICLSGDAEVSCYFFILDGRDGCSTSAIQAYGLAGPCAPVAEICHFCDPGAWWVWAGPSAYDPGIACGSLYDLTISGYSCGPETPTESTTWGRVKGLFR
jgi:hypothetical protein